MDNKSKDGENITILYNDSNSIDDNIKTIWPNSNITDINKNIFRSVLTEFFSDIIINLISIRILSDYILKTNKVILADEIAEILQKYLNHISVYRINKK